MALPPFAWIAFTAAVLRVVLLPDTVASTKRSMSKTVGLTAAPPVNGEAEIPTLMPPVDAYVDTPCNWYCHRLLSAGCQHAPPLHGTGAGGAAWASPTGT